MRTTTVLLALFLIPGTSHIAKAQADLPVVLSVGAHALTVPWYPQPLSAGLNPMVTVGTDRMPGAGEGWKAFFSASVSFFRHRWWMSGVSLVPSVGMGKTFRGGLQTDARIGFGYMHYFWRRETLELKNGRYVDSGNLGRPSIVLPLSVTIGYRGRAEEPLSVSPFVTGRWAIQELFLEEVPAITHLSVLGGVRINRGPARDREGS